MKGPKLATYIQALLAAEMWEAARLHLLHSVQSVRTREEGTLLAQVAREVPQKQWAEPGWARTMAWAAYRSGDVSLMRDVLALDAPDLNAFAAFLACTQGRWAGALQEAEVGLGGPDPVVAARYRAQALVRSGAPRWREAYGEALRLAQGRDRALARLDYAVALAWLEDDLSARPEFAQAAAEFAGDPWGRAFCLSNLGIICQRLGDLQGAERALVQAQKWAGKESTGQHLMAVQRGLGSVYRAYGEYPRAQHAFREALRLSITVEDRVAALLGEARTLALWGRPDEALSTLYDAAGQAGQLGPDGGDHRVFASVAAIRLLLGDDQGAQAGLDRAGDLTRDDGHLVAVVRAELLRRQGQVDDARDLLAARNMRPEWVGETARLFPALFTLMGIHAEPPAPWTAYVNAEGPVTVRMHGELLPLRPQRPEAALLVLLLLENGALRRERVQDALDLPGRDENARRKALSRVVGDLRAVLGWPGAVLTGNGLLRLSTEVKWVLHTAGPDKAESFCEGRLDPWVEDWRLQHAPIPSIF